MDITDWITAWTLPMVENPNATMNRSKTDSTRTWLQCRSLESEDTASVGN